MPIVSMEPNWELGCAQLGVFIGDCVGPFAQSGLEEAFGFSVGLWGVGAREDVAQVEGFAGFLEGLGAVARAIVGHDAFNPYSEFAIIGQGGLEKGDGAFLLFVRHDFGEGEARGVVDADMDELPSDAAAVGLAAAITGDAMADLVETPEFLMSMWMSSPGFSRS